MRPLVIFFAGPAASGKTEMAHYLSEQFGLPILETDSIRHDTKVAHDVVNINEVVGDFDKERDRRLKAMYDRKWWFIYDASVDRKWPDLKRQAEGAGYKWLLIDFDLSRDRIMKNRRMFDRPKFEEAELVEKWFSDHDKFHNSKDCEAQLHITDDNYGQRYELATDLVKKSLSN